MCNNDYDTAKQRQIALVELLQQHRARNGADNQRYNLCRVNQAVNVIIAQYIFAVIRQVRADDCGMYTGNGPENQGCPEVRIAQQSLNLAAGTNFFGIGCLLLQIDGLFAVKEADKQKNDCDDTPDAHGLNPCCLVIAHHLYNRQGKCNCDNLTDRRQCHAEDGQQVTLVRGTCHHGGQRTVRNVDCGVANGGAQVVGDKDVPELNRVAALRHTEHRNRAHSIRDSHPQNPRTRFAPLCLCLADQNAHDDIGEAVKYTGNQHGKTNGCHGYACIVCIEQRQQGTNHTKYNVAGGVAQTI